MSAVCSSRPVSMAAMAWAKSGGFGGAAILHLTMTRLVPSFILIKTIPIVTNLSIHSTLQNIELQNNFCVTLAGGARRSDRLSSIGLTRLPWFCQKIYGGPSGVLGRTIRFTRIQLTGPSAELLRTVRFTKRQPNSVSRWFCVFFLNGLRTVRVS